MDPKMRKRNRQQIKKDRKMRHITHILPTAAAATWLALCMAGCTQPEAAQPAATAALQVSSVSLRPAQAEVVTRASYQPDFPDPNGGDLISVVRPANDNYAEMGQAIFRNIPNHDGSSQIWDKVYREIILNAHDALVCGLYPQKAMDMLILDDPTAVPIQSWATSWINYDPLFNFSYDTQVMNAFHNTASFELKHAMAVMQIALKKSGGTCSLQEISIGEVVTQSTLDLSTATYADPPTEWGVVKNTLAAETELTTDFNLWEFLLVPYTVPVEGLKILLKVNGDYFSVTVPQATLAEVKPGYNYRVEILVNPVYARLTEVKIVPWEDVRVGNKEWHPILNGMQLGINVPAHEIDLGGSTCTQADKTLLGSLLWAEGNLMGTSLNTKDYYWAPTQNDYGYYYMWNSSYTTDNTPNNIDPCTLLAPEKYGTGWMAPPTHVWEALLRCYDTTITKIDEGTANERRGYWFMKKDKGLFLPFAGHRTGCGTMADEVQNNVALNEYKIAYWGSEAFAINPSLGRCIYGYETAYGGFSMAWSAEKNKGFAVRCVKVK